MRPVDREYPYSVSVCTKVSHYGGAYRSMMVRYSKEISQSSYSSNNKSSNNKSRIISQVIISQVISQVSPWYKLNLQIKSKSVTAAPGGF